MQEQENGAHTHHSFNVVLEEALEYIKEDEYVEVTQLVKRNFRKASK